MSAYRDDPTWKAKRQSFCRQVLELLHRALKGEIILLFEDENKLKQAVRHFFSYIAGLKDDVMKCMGNLQKLYSAEVAIKAEN